MVSSPNSESSILTGVTPGVKFLPVAFRGVKFAFRRFKSHGFRRYSLRRSILHNFAQNFGRNGWVDRKIKIVKVESRKKIDLKTQKNFIRNFIENPVENEKFWDRKFSIDFFPTGFSMKKFDENFLIFRSQKFSRLNFYEFYFSIYSTVSAKILCKIM